MTVSVPDDAKRLRAGFVRVRDGHGYKLALRVEDGAGGTLGTPPLRVARLLAFAHRIERRIAASEIADRAAAARELGVTRARLTQILNLTLLAPDIQEAILLAEAGPGFQPINERALRWVVRARDWPTQRRRWRDLNTV
jgi:hypothetical protein